MELRHLRYFQAIAEELSFSRAAKRLNIVQPALSRALKELEEELGTLLLARTQRKVELTAAGRALLEDTGLLFERMEQTLRRVRRASAGQEGELRLGYIGPPTHRFLGRLLEEYMRRSPRVTVHLEERTPERVWEMVAKGRLHVGLTRPVLAHAALGMQTELLREERLCAAIPRGHALHARKTLPWKALAEEPLIVLARREGAGLHDEILAGCLEAGFSPRILHTPSLIGTVVCYVEAGAGIGLIPESLRDTETERTWSLVPLQPARAVPLVMVWKTQYEEPPVIAFRALVKEWVQAGAHIEAGLNRCAGLHRMTPCALPRAPKYERAKQARPGGGARLRRDVIGGRGGLAKRWRECAWLYRGAQRRRLACAPHHRPEEPRAGMLRFD